MTSLCVSGTGAAATRASIKRRKGTARRGPFFWMNSRPYPRLIAPICMGEVRFADGLLDVLHLTFLSLTLCITVVKSAAENGLSN